MSGQTAHQLTSDHSENPDDHSAGPSAQDTKSLIPSNWLETITLPRWVVYTQAGLLGLVGTAFFLFGIVVGHFTSGNQTEDSVSFDCRVSGSIAYRINGDLKADQGAVVIFFPTDKRPNERAEGSLVNPGSFKQLDNIAIDRIHELGGAVVTANENGEFDVLIDGSFGNGKEYFMLAISKNKRGLDTSQMTKEQAATISTFFSPVEDVVEDRSYAWVKVTADSEKIGLPEIEL